MRLVGLVLALWATITLAQSSGQQNYINVPASGFDAAAGQPITITWSNPSSGTVTIKLTQGNVNSPSSGIVLESSVDASAETATFTIPQNVNLAAYNFEIVDNTNPDNVNFSSPFTISGGSASAVASSAAATATASATAVSGSASATASLSSLSTSASASASSDSSSHHSSMMTETSSSSPSSTSSTSTTATSVAASNDGIAVGISGMAALLAGAIAVF